MTDETGVVGGGKSSIKIYFRARLGASYRDNLKPIRKECKPGKVKTVWI